MNQSIPQSLKAQESRERYIKKQEAQGFNQIPRVRIRLDKGEEIRAFAQSLKFLNTTQLKRMVINEWISEYIDETLDELRSFDFNPLKERDAINLQKKLKSKGIILTAKEVQKAVLDYRRQFRIGGLTYVKDF